MASCTGDPNSTETGPSDNPAIINRFLANVQCIERIANTEAKKENFGSSQLQADIDALSANTPQADTAGRVINSDEASHAEPNDCLLPSQGNLKFRISG